MNLRKKNGEKNLKFGDFLKPGKVRKLAARILKCGESKVWFNPEESEKITSAMTKDDVRGLIKEGAIKESRENFQSRGKARKLHAKKSRGRKRSFGSRRGTKKARSGDKKQWIGKVRALRRELRKLKTEKPKAVEKIGYRKLYKMVNGNFFKGKRYLIAFVEGLKIKE